MGQRVEFGNGLITKRRLWSGPIVKWGHKLTIITSIIIVNVRMSHNKGWKMIRWFNWIKNTWRNITFIYITQLENSIIFKIFTCVSVIWQVVYGSCSFLLKNLNTFQSTLGSSIPWLDAVIGGQSAKVR